jgi:PAS domain S-box-containing protein
MPNEEEVEGSTFRPNDFGIGRLFLLVSDAVIVANARTERIVLWNRAARDMFGYTEEEALGLPLHTLVPQPLRHLHREGIARYQRTGSGQLLERAEPVELTALRKDRREIAIDLTLTRIPQVSETGDRFALAIVRDVSARKAAEVARRKLEEASAERRRAFELNDTIVQGLAAAKLALESGHHEEGLSSVAETLRRAQNLVSRILNQIEDAEGPIRPGDLVPGRFPERGAEPPSGTDTGGG